MSWSKSVTLWCDKGDAEYCPEHTGNLDTSRVSVARERMAEQRGWVHKNGEDICPYCNPEKTTEADM